MNTIEFLTGRERKLAYFRERRKAIKDGRWDPPSTKQPEQRVLARLDREHGFVPQHDPSLGACWNWLGARTLEGYGVISVRGRLQYVHRIALEMALGRPLAEGMFACHKCDNKSCARPRHLYEGTASDNQRDTWERIRGVA